MGERRRSHWGWGWADRFSAPEERENLATMVRSVLRFDVEQIAEPVPLEAIALSAPRIDDPAPAFCTTDAHARITHTYGRAYPDIVRGFRGAYEGAPDLVAYPEREEDVVAALAWADAHDVAVVPFGGGTSVVGGVETGEIEGYAGVLSLDMSRLGAVREIDDVSLVARIEAGAFGPQIEQRLGQQGLTLRHYPQSFEFSTLGGWIATRAGGHFATLRTHIDDFVEATRMITPAGTFETRRVPASGAGPDPDRLVMGSEGALGVITEAWMRVQRRPRFRSSASFRFARYEDAVEAVRVLAQSGLNPANCRLLDRREAMLNGVVMDGSNVLIVGFESPGCPTKPLMEQAAHICLDAGGTCPDGVRHRDAQTERERDGAAGSWKQAFFEGPYLQSNLVSLGVMADTFETACTWERFEEFHAGVKAAVKDALREVCGAGFVASRFTHVYPDGPAPYYTFVGPVRFGSELEQWAEIKHAAAEAVSSLGGTITHHHAVGRVHRPWYDRERPEIFARMLRAAKREVDPSWILNPGVLVDRETS